jgi:hypothetical protein
MRKSFLIASLLLVTCANVISALVCVHTASRPAQTSSQVRADLEALRIAVDQQNAVLNRAIGNVIPVQMPADFEKRFHELEDTTRDKQKWPKTEKDAGDMRTRLTILVKQLPAWAEPDYLPRLTPLRWSVQAISVLTAPGENGDESVSAIDSLLESVPDGASSDMLGALKSRRASCEQTASSLRRDQEVARAKTLLSGASGDAAAEWTALEKWTDDPANGSEIQNLRSDLRKMALTTEAERQSALITKQWDQLKALSDDKLMQQGLVRLYDSAMSQRLALAAEGIQSSSVDQVASNLQHDITELAKKQSDEQAAKLRAYQAWALDQIDGFWTVKANADQQAKNENKLPTSGWNDAEYKMLRDAMSSYLLPVVPGLLDPPVLERYNEAFHFGWQQLDKREDQTEVARRSAAVEKHMP